MNDIRAKFKEKRSSPEALAAELTAAAYPVALRYGLAGKWLDLELDLWQVLTQTVQKWSRTSQQAC